MNIFTIKSLKTLLVDMRRTFYYYTEHTITNNWIYRRYFDKTIMIKKNQEPVLKKIKNIY